MPTREKWAHARPAKTYRAARRPEMIKLQKQRRRELLERELKQPLNRVSINKPPRPDPNSREAARRRRQMAAGQLQR
jgi:hypothetical protein